MALQQRNTSTKQGLCFKKWIIDTKFYEEALVTHYGKEKIRSDHLYQLHAYLTNLEHKGGINKDCTGVLLYPKLPKRFLVISS